MLIQFLQDNHHTEIAYTVAYNDYYIAIRQITPIQFDAKPWFTCYVNKKKEYTAEELESIPAWCIITWNNVYPDSWAWSELSGKEVIGWDYNHDIEEERYKSIQSIISDAHKVIDYLEEKSNK